MLQLSKHKLLAFDEVFHRTTYLIHALWFNQNCLSPRVAYQKLLDKMSAPTEYTNAIYSEVAGEKFDIQNGASPIPVSTAG